MNAVMTGRKVLAIFVLMFGTIIAVNLTLAFNAVKTFPGLETKNSYVASQKFEAQRAAQEALGWASTAHVADGMLILDLRHADGTPVADAQITSVLGRATNVSDDIVPAFAFDGAVWRAPVDLRPGNWDLRLEAVATDGTLFQKRLKLARVQ
ncbi:MAG: FixH family protein [Pseudomonadota bacterium]